MYLPTQGFIFLALFSKHDIKISVLAYLSQIYSYLLDPVDFVLDWNAYLNTDTKLAEKGVYCIYLNLQN